MIPYLLIEPFPFRNGLCREPDSPLTWKASRDKPELLFALPVSASAVFATAANKALEPNLSFTAALIL